MVLGIEGIMSLVSGWLEEQTVKYRMSALLNEVYISEPVQPIDGLLIAPLPRSSNELPASLPGGRTYSPTDDLGRTVVSIDCTATPALFRPPPHRRFPDVQTASVPHIGPYEVCQALALECDQYVDVGFWWNDYLGLEEAFPFSGSSIWSTGGEHLMTGTSFGQSLDRDPATGITTLTSEDYAITTLTGVIIRRALKALQAPNSKGIRNSVSRWTKSKDNRQGLEDQFIDLRIALEHLYLGWGSNAELGFRLALSGAWHLGNNLEDRRNIYKTLRKAYNQGSAAVHPHDLVLSRENYELFSDAQAICRRGIFKMLQEGPPQDREDLLLGG